MNVSDIFPDTQGIPSPAMMAPRFAEIIEEVRSFAPALYGHPWTDAAMVEAPDDARRAWVRIRNLSEVHAAMRGWQDQWRRTVHRPSGQEDVTFWDSPYAPHVAGRVGTFFDSRKFPEIAPGVLVPRPSTISRPGPEEPLARLVWLATDPTAEPWMPEPEEQDARFREFQAAIASANRTRRAGERVLRVATR